MRARILRSSQREFDCRLESGEQVQARALGNLLKSEESVVVGDYVSLRQEGEEWVIFEREDRTSEIFRHLVRENKKKITAANCDLLVILTSVSKPQYKRGILDRFLVRAHQWQIKPIVVFNKMDEWEEGNDLDLNFEVDRLLELGVEGYEISCVEPERKPQFLGLGLEDLRSRLKGKTSILLGQSGVGKSSTINALAPEHAEQLKTKMVGKAGKGTHTTTWSEIVDFGLFDLIDSPGIRSFSLEDIHPEELISYFSDIEPIAGACQFSNCTHLEGSKGCAFWKLDPDNRQTQLVFSRLESYLRIRAEISETPTWAKKV